MKIRRQKLTATSLILGLVGFLIWQCTPAQSIFALSSLTDPAKLATLGERGANSRLNKIVFWLHQAEQKGMSRETAIHCAQTFNGTERRRAELVKESLVRNMKIAHELGLLTDSNLQKLQRGNSAIVRDGPYAGEPVEIDHIVPFSLAPEMGNELANLEMLPQTLNRKKSNRVNERQFTHAQKLFEAGLLTEESFTRVKTQRR